MKQESQVGQSAPEQTAEGKLNAGRWLGRHEALDMVAHSCSGVDAACLKKIRDEKLYLDVAPNWDQFCRKELRTTRKRIDGMIRRLNEFGPAYFDLLRLTHVTADEYRQIAPAVSAEGVKIDGEVIAIAPGTVGAFVNRGAAYVNLKQYDLALADLDQALTLHPDNVVALTNRGAVYEMSKQYDKALADYDRALVLAPDRVGFVPHPASQAAIPRRTASPCLSSPLRMAWRTLGYDSR